MKKITIKIYFFLLVVFLFSCGGGGGTSNNNPESKTGNNNSKQSPLFSPLSFHKSVTFQDKIWVIGGGPESTSDCHHLNADTGCGDVWSSPDGIKWDLVNETGDALDVIFPYLAYIFNNNIIIDEIFKNRILSSPDGKNWQETTFDFPNQTGNIRITALTTHNSILNWINTRNLQENRHTLFESTDFKNWREIATTDQLTFSRGDFFHTFNSSYFYIDGTKTYQSNDGIDWTTTTTDNNPIASARNIIIASNQAYTIGGSFVDRNSQEAIIPLTISTEIYSTTNFINFNKNKNANWPKRDYFSLAYFKNKIWLIGGVRIDNLEKTTPDRYHKFKNPIFYNDVWSWDRQAGSDWVKVR